MHKDTGRTRKIGELLQRELAVMVARELNDPRVTQVTLTAVDVAPDMSHAKIFITHLGGQEQALKALAGLNSAAGFLQRALRDRVILRKVPALRFVYDESVERGDNIERLLARARHDSGEAE